VREDGPVATSWLRRTAAYAADTALVLAAVEAFVLMATCPGARRAGVIAMDAGLAMGALLVVALVPAALLAIRPPSAGWARAAMVVGGAAVAVGGMQVDAEAYVRLYAPYHAALGAVIVASVVAVRSAFRAGERTGVARVAVVLVAAAVAGVAVRGSRDGWAYIGQRGVLVADAIWAARKDVTALPPMPMPTAPSGSSATSDSTVVPRPSLILLVTIDALRADVARSVAYPVLETVRANAVDFTDARAPAAWTVPSTYGMLTGRGPWNVRWTRAAFFGEVARPYDGPDSFRTRVWPAPLEDRSPTLAEALHALGYETRTCASLPLLNRAAGVTRGFDVVDDGVYRTRNPTMRGITSDMLTACGIAMIDAAKGAPLFLWLHYSDPHEPYLTHPGVLVVGDEPKSRYAGEVAFVDKHLGGLLANVEKRVGLDHTLVVVTADHGEEFDEHGGEFHGATLYDEILRVPLLVAMPGIAPRKVDAPVSLLDVAPTILQLAGGDAAKLDALDGRSLAGAMRGEALEARPVFAQTVRYGRGSRAMVDGEWKLIYEARAGTWELFDLAKDPGEQRVVTDEEPDVMRRLAARMGVAP
jgi:arylsulfatase A-like enzyme